MYQNKLDKAEIQSKMAIDLEIKLFGNKNPHLAIRFNNIGLIYYK